MASAEPPAKNRTDDLLEAQSSVLEMIVRGRPLAEVLAELCGIVDAHGAGDTRAAILLVDADGKRLVTGAAPRLPSSYCQAVDGIAIDADVGTCCAAAATNQVIVTKDIATAPGWRALRDLPLGLGLRAAWSMPIVSSTGTVLGTFGTYFHDAREPRPDERRLVAVLARTAALAIERRRADDALQASARRDRFLAELAAATQPLAEPSAVLATTSRMLAQHLSADGCAYAEVEDEETFVIAGDHARGGPSIVGRWPLAAFGPACVRQLKAAQPYVVSDTQNDPEIGEHRPTYAAANIGAVVAMPLHKQGKLTAGMAVHQRSPREWTADEVELVGIVTARCWEALERARITRELRDSEARHRAIVEASPACVKLVGLDGTLLQMNAAGLAMIERDEGAAIGRCVYDVVAPEHREAFRAFNERVCRGQGGTLSFDIVGGRGTRRSMETTAVPLAAADGGFAQLAVTHDVTSRVASDRALAESRARLEYAVRLSGVGFWYCDLPFDELVWDARVKAHFFLPSDARVTIDLFYQRIHPDDRLATRAAIEKSIAERTSYDVIYRTVDPESGAIKFIRALGGTAYDAEGRPTHFDGVTVDVTAQKQAEERLARGLDREREQARLLKKVANAALTIHAASSVSSVLRVTTEEARTLIGAHRAFTRSTVTGADGAPLAAVSTSEKGAGGEGPLVSAHALEAIVCATNRSLRMSQAELEAQPADLSAKDERLAAVGGWLAAPFIGHGGVNLGLIQLHQKMDGDFTEADEAILVQLAQIAAVALENAKLYEALREQDRRKDEFLATLAHELRNPLAPIRTGLHVLQLTNDPSRMAQTRAVMERQLGHLVRMIDDLLDISRITLGKLTLRKERVDFRTVLHSALETSRPVLDALSHELVVSAPEGPLPLFADPTRIAQVVSNLVNNAAKYTPARGLISLTALREGGELVFRVQDNGVGIPAEMLGRVFDMFTQVGEAAERAPGGLGLGLTLVRRLTAMHGGSVSADSAGPGLGSTFTVRLPLAEADQAGTQAPSSSVASSAGGLRVLVVDDNIDGAESLATLLELGGHRTRVAHTGPDAISAASDFQPQVVFLDIGLPGFSGYEVAKRLRADASLPQPVLVAVTGWGSAADRQRAHAAGFDRHLVKPVDIANVQSILSAVPATV